MSEQAMDPLAALWAADEEQRFDAHAAAEALRECLLGGQDGALGPWFEKTLAADIAETLTHLDSAEIVRLLPLIAIEERARVFGYLPIELQAAIVPLLSRPLIARLFERMGSDERVDLYKALPEAAREHLMPALAQAEREDIRRLAAYREDSAGSIMTSDYATLAPNLSAREAVEELRRVAPDKETIYNAYVIDEERRLLGVLTLRRLITATPGQKVSELMHADPVVGLVDEDQEVVAERIARYDFIALPIVDAGGRLVGIVTADDAMDVAKAEATEDFHKAGGSIGRMAVGIREASIGLLYRQRVVWLVLLVFGNVFSGAGIAVFEDLIAANVALVFFLPMLIGSGGNAGAQASTLMVRALATGEVELRDWAGMLLRELLVAGLLGFTMAFAVSWLGLLRGGVEVALVVAISMQAIVVVGSLIGMSLPFLLSRFRADPATASAPLITSICDVSGILIYFGVATLVLPGVIEAI